MSNTYILLKDTILNKTGTKFIKNIFNRISPPVYTADSLNETYNAHYVENNPEWFKKEEPIDWQKEYSLQGEVLRRSQESAEEWKEKYENMRKDRDRYVNRMIEYRDKYEKNIRNPYLSIEDCLKARNMEYTKTDMCDAFHAGRKSIAPIHEGHFWYKNFTKYLESLK